MQVLRFINDYIFKHILGREENLPALLDLINAVLEEGGFPLARELRFLNTEQTPSASYLKKSVLDIRALDDQGREFDVEVQVVNHNNYTNRSLYYWSQLYLNQLKSSDDYGELHPVICINLVDFILFPDIPSAHNCFMIKHKDLADTFLTEDLTICFVELAKEAVGNSKLADWITYLRNEEEGETSMKVLLQRNQLFAGLHQTFKRTTQNELDRAYALAQEKRDRDELARLNSATKNALAEGKAEGKAEGIAEGKARANIENAKNFKKLGVATDIIAKATGLSEEEINKL